MTHQATDKLARLINPELAAAYAPRILPRIPALLGTLDRGRWSPGYGSFDREHWAWKFRDFPLGMLQVSAYPLALLWRYDLPDNPYHGDPRILEWITGALEQTASRQHRNGAFDGFSPNEQDPGPTVGVMHGMAEAFELIREALSEDAKSRLLDSIRRAGEFGLEELETHAFVSNHWALFASAYAQASAVCSDVRFANRGEEIIDRIVEEQSADGWYREYGGVDAGYESLGIFHLAMYWKRTGSHRVLASLKRSLEVYSHFIQLDGGIASQCGSRNTALYQPGGFELIRSEIPMAGAVADFMRPRLDRLNVVTPTTCDAENVASFAYSYLEACFGPGRPGDAVGRLPCETLRGTEKFEECATVFVGTDAYYATLGGAKGGACRICDRANEVVTHEDGGYLLQQGKRQWSSQWLGAGTLEPGSSDGAFRVRARFAEMDHVTLTPPRFLLLRFLNLTAFRSRILGRWLRKMIVARLITRRVLGPFRLDRTVQFDEERVSFIDSIVPEGQMRVDEARLSRSFNPVHMGSARYFHPYELLVDDVPTEGLADTLSAGGASEIRFTIPSA